MPLKTRDTLSSNANFNAQGIELQKTQLTHLSNLSSAVSNGTMAISGTISGGGDASATNQLAMLTSLQSLDSKTSQMTSSNNILKVKCIGNDGNDGVGTDRNIRCDNDGTVRTHSVLNDIRLGNINTKLSDGTQKSIILGNDGNDGSGTSRTLKTDSNGILSTNIASQTGNLNVKLEDLSSSIDAEHANNSRSLPTTMKARTSIADNTSGKYLLCSSLGELKVEINEIKAGILNSINTHNTNQNTNTQVLTNAVVGVGSFLQSTAITTINGGNQNFRTEISGSSTEYKSNSVVIYIHTGAGTDTSKFSFEVHKSYDNTHFFLDPNFTFLIAGMDVNAVNQPAVIAKSEFDARFIRVKVNNLSEANSTLVNAYIQQRQ